nr:MAG TPA: hypothetical protein [Caudoviricetes sp.]
MEDTRRRDQINRIISKYQPAVFLCAANLF